MIFIFSTNITLENTCSWRNSRIDKPESCAVYQLVGIEFYRDRRTVRDDERIRTGGSVEFINSGGRRSVAGGRIGGNLAE